MIRRTLMFLTLIGIALSMPLAEPRPVEITLVRWPHT
jgi:hypothetical protein